MSFVLLPAVDVADGRAVRLVRGASVAGTTVGDPRAAALALQRDGASWIHLVDLDAAFGRGSNAELLAAVIDELDVDIELAGGVCDDRALTWALSTGCTRVVLGSAAVDDLDWCARAIAAHGDRVAVGLDVSAAPGAGDGEQYRITARGRPSVGGDLWAVLDRLDRAGCARYVVTDVSADGAMSGPNIDLYRAVAEATPAPVVASGGVASVADLVALADLAASGSNLEGAIVGTALATGRFTLPDALAATRRASEPELGR